MTWVSSQQVPGAVVDELPADPGEALIATAVRAGNDIMPLARGEEARQGTTGVRCIREEPEEGMRSPCRSQRPPAGR